MSRRRRQQPLPRNWGRWVLPAVAGVALYFALFGGEFTVFDVRNARQDIARAQDELAELRRETDSLRAWADSLQNDPVVLERIARERFGLIRDGEYVYWPVADSTGSGPTTN